MDLCVSEWMHECAHFCVCGMLCMFVKYSSWKAFCINSVSKADLRRIHIQFVCMCIFFSLVKIFFTALSCFVTFLCGWNLLLLSRLYFFLVETQDKWIKSSYKYAVIAYVICLWESFVIFFVDLTFFFHFTLERLPVLHRYSHSNMYSTYYNGKAD